MDRLPPITTLRLSDPEQLIAGVRGAQLQACQLDLGPAPSELARVLFDDTCLDMAHVGPAMLFSGVTPADCYTFIFILACPRPGHSFNFQIEHADGYMGFFAPGGVLDAMTPAGYRNGTLTLPAAALHKALATHFDDPPEELLENGGAMLVGAEAQKRLRAILRTMWRMMWDPAQPLASAAVRREAGRSVRAAFLEALRSGAEHRIYSPTLRIAKRHRRFRQARDFIEAHLHVPIYVDDVCDSSGLARRALESLFQDFLGVTPTTYLRHQRLHGVHRILQHTPRAPGVVKHTALEWGFWHQGHFARDYHALFGETPHETLV